MARINEVINFLERNAPSELAQLRSLSPSHDAALVPDMCGVAAPATLIRAQATLVTLRLWAPQLPPLLAMEVKRFKRTSRFDDQASFWTMIAAGITAITVFLPSGWAWLKIAAPVATMIGSVCSWESKRRNRLIFEHAPGTLAATLVDAGSSINQWLIDLEAYLDPHDTNDYSAQVEKILEQANNLFRELNRARFALTVPAVAP